MPDPSAPPVSLVVLAWNRWDLTRRCLDSLLETDLTGAEVLVVDNGSTDETPEALKRYEGVRVLRLSQNLGFVRGNNAGIEACDPASDVVLLNNDLELTQHDWLQRMRQVAHSAPDVGVVGCRLVRPDGELLHAGVYVLPDTCWGQQLGSQEKDVGQYADRDREVESVVFACAYLKRSLVDRIGGLSTEFESYFEDTDYCLRAREAGFRVVVCGGVTLIHLEHGSTQQAPEEFSRLFQRSRRVFRRKWRRKLEKRYRSRVLWQSTMSVPSEYSASCRALLHHLDDLGVRVTYRHLHDRGTDIPMEEQNELRDHRLSVIHGRKAPRFGPSVAFGRGDSFDRSAGRYRIGYTMLEVDGFPAEWVRQANQLEEIWVPTEFNRQGFLVSGLRRPIHKIPLGINPSYFHPGISTLKNQRDEYVFLSIFEWKLRTNPWLLLRAFNDVFSFSEPARLICKITNRASKVDLKEEIGNIGLRANGGRISYLLNVRFPCHQLGSLYRAADCYVSTSRGEGWNAQLIEAMACGLPAIATDWGAHREYLHSGVGYPLEACRLIPAMANCPDYVGFHWAEPDESHLRTLLREVYENRGEAKRRGEAAAQEVAATWTWRQCAERIAARLEEV